jgi:hypothetical protein
MEKLENKVGREAVGIALAAWFRALVGTAYSAARSAFHAGAEQVGKTLEVDQAGPYAAWLNHFRDWFQANCVRLLWCERVLVNLALGYAGTADLLIEHRAYGLTLVDLKSQHIKGKSGPATYRTWGYQLAAYRKALGRDVVCMNLIMNSREPHPPVEAPWSEEQMEVNWRGFQAARQLWVIEKNYDPTGQRPEYGGQRAEGGAGVSVPVGDLPGGPCLTAGAAKELCAA